MADLIENLNLNIQNSSKENNRKEEEKMEQRISMSVGELTDNISQLKVSESPSIESGNKYYDGIHRYISPSGLLFKPEECLSIKDMEELLDVEIPMVGKCLLNNRENNPLRYKKNGELIKKQKEIINGENYEGVLINFKGESDELWNKDNTEGIYFITFNGYIVKIGMTENTFSARFSSYICGSRRAMKKGSCSTTNFIICEVLYASLKLGFDVDIYGIQIPKEKKEIEIYGQKINCPVSVVRAHEEIITNIYKNKIGKIPPLCIQHAKNL